MKNEKTTPEEMAAEETAEAVETQAEETAEQTIEEKLVAELAAQKDMYLRLMAEYENFRKRTAKEKTGIYADAKADAFSALIPVIDNFERAFQNPDASPEDFKKGIEMTQTQLLEIFAKEGVEAFAEPGEQFDPNIHNAVMHVEDDSLEENVITDVFQKGYKIGDKVIRHAMVKVAN